MEKVERSKVAWGLRRWEKDKLAEHNFYSSEIILCDTEMVIKWHYEFVRTHRMYNTKY